MRRWRPLKRGKFIIIAFGAQSVFDHEMTIGALIAFQMLSGRVVTPLVQIVSLVQEYQEAALSVRMLATVMNHPPEQRRTSGLTPSLTGAVEFDRVSFRYAAGGAQVLDRVSLKIPAGAVVGVVGRSGSGKTTLARLMQGLYPVQEGVIRFDGVDIREIDLAHLRRNMGAVLQDSFLFRGTIRENIAATKPWASIQEVIAAAQIAGPTSSSSVCPRDSTRQSKRTQRTSRVVRSSVWRLRVLC